MSNTAVAVASLQVETFPAGTTSGNVLFSLIDSTSNVVSTAVVATGQTDTAAQASFTITTPDTYTVTAVRQDASGNTLGNVATSAAFVIAAPVTVNVSVPVTVTVTVS